MLKISFNVKKIILGLAATVLTVGGGIGVYQITNNRKENSDVSFEQRLVAAAKQYVEDNQISVEKEIKTTAEYLENTGDFSRGEKDDQCASYSYVVVRNENGTYSYDPVLICENPEKTKDMNLAIGYMMEQALDDIETPVPTLDYELSYSTKKPTNKNVTVTFETNFPARIISTTGKISDWTITAGKNGESTVFTKVFENPGKETIVIEDLDAKFQEITINVDVNNIDKVFPKVEGVEDGKTYPDERTITFDEGKATLVKNGGEAQEFKSGTKVSEGTYVLKVEDAAGNITTVNFTIDTTAPEITFTSGDKTSTTTGIDNTIYYYNTPVTVEVTDTTSLKTLTYTFNGGEEQPFTSSKVFDKVGTYVIKAVDSSSETGYTSTKTFVYNTSKPVIKNVKHGGQFTAPVEVIVEDDLPITAMFTRNNGEQQEFTVKSNYVDGKYVSSVMLTQEGRYVVTATDAAGNKLEKENTTFVLDWTAPTIEGIENGGYYGNSSNIKITFHDKDNLTAVKDLTVILTKPDGTTENIASGTTLENFTDGSYTLEVKDKAKNSVKYTFTVDTKNKIDVDIDFDTTITKDPVEVTVTFNKPVKITSNNANLFKADGADSLGYASVYTITIYDEKTVNFAFTDRLGLTGTSEITVPNIDVVSPEFEGATTNPSGLTNADKVVVTLNFSEAVRIIKSNGGDYIPVSPNKDGLATSYTVEVDGNKTIEFEFEDQVGLTGKASYTVTNIDHNSPKITLSSGGKVEEIIKTTEGKIYYFGGTVTVEFEDEEGDVTARFGSESGLTSGAQIKGDGTYTVTAIDEAGNETSVTFIIDTVAPTIGVSSDGNHGTDKDIDVYGGNVTISVTETSPYTVWSSLNGGKETQLTQNADGNYVIEATEAANGVYTIKVRDEAGNSKTATFRIDTKKPDVTLTSKEESFTDEDGKTYYKSEVTFTINDATKTTVSATLDGKDYPLTGNTVSESGDYQLTVTDVVGNESVIDFAIDSTAPVIEISSDAKKVEDKGVDVYGGNVTITVKDATLNIVKSKLNDAEPVEIKLDSQGKYVITATKDTNGLYVITATDKAGHTATKTFRIDSEAPVLVGAEHGKHYNDKNISISIKDDSTYTGSYTITNGETKDIIGNVLLTKEGRYTVVASDVVGNVLKNSPGKDYITFIVDWTAPVVTGVKDGEFYGVDAKKTPITFKDNLASAAQTTATLTKPDGKKEAFASGTTLENYADGEYTLTVEDKAGNVTVITFTIDTQEPEIEPELPEDVELDENGTFETVKEVAKTGTYSGITITPGEGVTITKVITDSEGTVIEEIPLTALGTYTITYTAENKAHNKKVITETVKVVDTKGPEIEIIAVDKDGNPVTGKELMKGDKKYTFYNVPVKVTANDILTLPEDLVAFDNDEGYILGNAISLNGEHTITVEDEEGNSSSVTFVIDTNAPMITDGTGVEIEDGIYKQILENLTLSDLTTNYELDGEPVKITATYTYNGGEAQEFIGGTLDKDGKYVITLKDVVGNEKTISFTLDATAPKIKKMEIDPKVSTKGNVTLKVTFTENVNILTSTITINGKKQEVEMTQVGDSKNVYQVVATDNGTIEFTFEDEVGHPGTKGEYEINNIDRIPPTMTFPNNITVKDDAFTTEKEVSNEGTYTGISNDDITVDDVMSKPVTITKVIKQGTAEVESIDLTHLGTYTITYTATDNVGNAKTVTETVVVKDSKPPVITVDGDVTLIIVEKGKTITYPNVTATDILDGAVTVTDDRANVDVNTARDYTVTFTATDSSNNSATKEITVRVLDLDRLRAEEAKLAQLEQAVNDNVFEAVVENKNDYTEASWNAKKALIDALNALVNGEAKESTTQSFVNSKMEEIEGSKLDPKDLDRKKYNQAMANANKLTEGDYTEASWNNLAEKKGQDITNIKLQSELNAITKSIEQAIEDLQAIDFKAYVDEKVKELQDKLKTYIKTDYSSDSYDAAEKAIEALKNSTIYYGGEIKVKSEFDKLLKDVDVEALLVKLPIDATRLNNLKDELKKLNKDDYTKASWDAIQNLIKDVEAIIERDGLRSEFETAMNKINLESLVLIPKVDEDGMSLHSSSNSNFAKAGDTLTLTFKGNSALANATVTINGKEAVVTKTDTGFVATVTVADGDKEGKVSYTVTPVGDEVKPVTKESNITVDVTAPTLEISPSTPDGKNDWYVENPTINIVELDDQYGIDYENSTYEIKVGEEVVTGKLTSGQTTIPVSTTASGEITVTVTITDNAGNPTTKSVTVKKDATKPTITITDKDGNPITGKEIDGVIFYQKPVKVNATDTYSGNVTATYGNDTAYFLGTLIENDARYTITVTDEAGNESDITFVVDHNGPTIVVNSESTGIDVGGIKYYNKKVTVSATDIISDSANLTATDNGNPYTLGADITENGRHEIIVTDEAGNTSSVTFVIDSVPPVINLDNNSTHGGKVEFTVDDDTQVTVVAKVTALDGTTTTTTLTKGENGKYSVEIDGSYEITATDQAGNPTTKKITIDSVPPVIDVEDNSYHKEDVEFTVTDQTEKTVVITKDGTEISLTPVDGTYTATEEGVYTVTATDAAGLSTKKTFTIDKTNPKLKVGEELIKEKQIFDANITFTIDDKTPVTLTKGESTPAITDNGDGTYTTTAEGVYVITLTDKAGNSETITFYVDTTAPTTDLLEKVYPGKVEFTVTDTTTVKVTSKFTPLQGDATTTVLTKGENGKYSVETDGSYEITIEDGAGNSITKSFVIDSKAPVFNIEDDSYHKTDVKVTVDDATELDIAFDSTPINGGEANLEYGADGSMTVSGDGIYTFTATDEAGNTAEITFTIDTKVPVFKNIENGKSYKSGVTIEVEDATLDTIHLGSSIIMNGNTVSGEGTYTVTATDKAGNETRITFTIDDTAPEITLPDDITVEDNAFTTVLEVSDKGTYTGIADQITSTEEVTVKAVITNKDNEEISEISLTTLGTYTITYTIADAAGNTVTVTETVIVKDTKAPVITVEGNVTLIIVEKGKTVTYPNVTATDILDGAVTVTDDRANVDVNTAGDYTVTFTATDSSNNSATKEITVRVLDLDRLRAEERKLQALISFMDPEGDKFGSYNENKDDYTDASWDAKQALIDELNNIINGNSDMNPEDITQAFVDGKMDAIEKSTLTPKELDLTEYNEQIKRFDALIETDYTPETWRIAKEYRNQSIKGMLQSDLNHLTRALLKGAIRDLERLDLYAYANSEMKKFMQDYKFGDYDETIHNQAIDDLINYTLPIMYDHKAVLKSELDAKITELREKVEAARLPIDPKALEDLKADLKENYNEADYTKESWKNIQDLIKDVEKVVADNGLRSEFKDAMDKIDLENLVLIPKVDTESIEITSTNKNKNYAKLGDTITLTFNGNKALQNATVTINGKTANVTKTDTGFEATVTVEENDKEGKVSYTITPDGTEVTPVTKESKLIVDLTNPTVDITVPAPDGKNNWYIKNPTVQINTLTDENEIDYTTSYYTVTVNGKEVVKGSLLNDETPITNIPVNTEESGEIKVTVVVFDQAGNRNTAEKTVNVDKELPTVTISDADKSYTFDGLGDVPTYYFKGNVMITATDNITAEAYPIIRFNGNNIYVPGTEFASDNIINVEVEDVAGHVIQVKFVVDASAPNISLKDKNNVEAVGKDHEEVDGTVTYYKENLNLSIYDNIDKDLTIQATFTNQAGEVSDIQLEKDEHGVYTASLSEIGKYAITVTDDSGFTTTKVFVIDTELPNISGVKHGSQYKDPSLTITFDDYSLDSATLNGKPFTSGSAIEEEGKHILVVTDKAGNKKTVAFVLDSTKPTVILTSEEVTTEIENTEKVYYYKDSVTVAYEDRGNLSQFPVLTGKITFKSDKPDAGEATTRTLTNGETVTEEGTYTVVIKDKAGNETTVNFVIDKTVPVITSPIDGAVYGGDVTIEFTKGIAKIGDVEYKNGDTFGEEGTHTIVVTDAAGNTVSATFTIDTTVPVVSGIENEQIYTSDVEITVKDATKTSVKIDGKEIFNELLPEAGKTFIYGEEGKHTLVAVDEGGNTTKVVNFVIDKLPPEITGLKDPYTTETVDGNVIKYYKEPQTLTFSDETLDYVQSNGTTITLVDMKYTFDQDGYYEVVATDKAGHSSTERFVIDTTAPTIKGVEEGKHYGVRPEISATDDNLLSITIDGNPITNDYAEGEHTVTATDKLGHETSMKFVYDITPPTITITDGENTYTDNATITVDASNGSYTNPNATATDNFSKDISVKIEGKVDLSKLVPQEITYTAKDEAGNVRTVILTVNVVDNEAPTDLTYEILNGSEDIVNEWYIKPLKVKLNATDNGTGVSEYQYRILSNGTPVTDWITLKDFASPTFTMPENISGNKITFEVKAFDAAGNFIEKTSEEFKIDQDTPNVEAKVTENANENGWYKKDINVLLKGSDATSTITHFLYEISLGNGLWTEVARITAENNEATLVLRDESDEISYRVIAVDEAGHRSVAFENEKALKLDKTAPTITIKDGDKTYVKDTTVTAEADRNGTYNIPNATVTDNLDQSISVSQTGTVSLVKLENQDIIYTATDLAGNTTTIVLTVAVDDTKAPVITLNGEETEKLSYGTTYQDKGATAIDNLDGEVTVTATYKIDPYQIKSYTVTYTAVDKKGNKTTKTRTVTVTPVSTSDVIKDKSECKESGTCYVTTITDDNGNDQTENYIWYSGRLWRAYIVNQDNTIKLVTEESMSGFAYNDGTSYKFSGSYVEDWLNGTFYKTLKNAPKIVVPTTYCNARITATTNARETCATKYQVPNTNVALLTMDEYNLLGGARSFLYTGDAFYTMSGSSATDLVVIVENGTVEFGYKGHEPYAMRPVITIPADIDIVSGKGTKSDPYFIQKNETAAAGTNLNERNTGEYVQFGNNGQVWRIMKTDGTSTRLISDSFYQENGNYVRMQYGDPSAFTTTSGVGQYLNTTVYNDLFTEKEKKEMLLTKWYYNGYKLGDNPKNTTLLASSTYTYAYVGLASVGEMMTAQSVTGKVKGLSSWAINPNPQYKGKSWYFTSVGGSDYYETAGHTRGIRPVIELNPKIKIKSGNGTATSPYVLEY